LPTLAKWSARRKFTDLYTLAELEKKKTKKQKTKNKNKKHRKFKSGVICFRTKFYLRVFNFRNVLI